jgi:hypothetical protein
LAGYEIGLDGEWHGVPQLTRPGFRRRNLALQAIILCASNTYGMCTPTIRARA